MIVTSNSVTHTINVTSLTKIGQVDSNIDVVNSAFVTIGSTIGYAHTFTKNVGSGAVSYTHLTLPTSDLV